MASTTLTFTQSNGEYVCTLPTTAAVSGVAHLALSEPNQNVTVWAGAPDMPPMVADVLNTPYSLGLVFELDFPQGVNVTLRTGKPVTSAVWIASATE